MKRSLKFMAWTTFAVSLLAAGPGCSHETQPAQAPPEGTTSPPFESNVGPGPAAPQPAPEMGAPSSGESPRAEPPQAGQPGMAPGAADEHELCNSLSSAAHLKVEDAPNGVVILMTPKGNTDLPTLHDDARRIEDAIHAGPGREATGAGSCGLFTLGRLPSVRTQVVDQAGSVALVMTTTNPAEVKDLRRQARDEVSNIGKSR